MDIIVNTKNKFNKDELSKYLENVKQFNVSVCVPNEYLNDINSKNIYSQNYTDLETIVTSNIKGVLIGHSHYKESAKEINYKLMELKSNQIDVVLCIGEEKENKNSKKILSNLLDEYLLSINDCENIIIAYEPLWAIGGDKAIDIDYIIENGEFIYNYLLYKYKTKPTIYYGGSVNLEIIKKLSKKSIYKGVLVSTYAINLDNLLNIVNLGI